MEQLFAQLLTLGRRMWKYRWAGLLAAWLVGALGVLVALLLPNRYEASARIYVDTQSILKPLMSGLAVQPNVDTQVQMLSRTLISRPNMEKLVRMADLDLGNQSKAQQEALIEMLTRELSIRSTAKDNLYTLSYRDKDPDTAKRVVQSLVSIFVESSLGASRKETATATTFINEQIKNYEAKLEEAEARLKEFRLRNLELTASEGKDAAARLGELSNQLDRARLELREAENARSAAKQQLAAEKSRLDSAAQTALQDPSAFAMPEMDARIDAQKRNLDVLLQRFTDQHPDVIQTRKLIKDLEDQKKRELAEMRRNSSGASTGGGGSGTPVQQELSRMLATTEVQVAQLQARVGEYSARYQQALSALKTAPQLEAEAAQLNRDYAVHKKNYEELVARRESAAISGELDVASGVADFRLIDPPRASNQPVAPNRLVLLAAAWGLSVAAGLGTSFIASQLRPVFHDTLELRDVTELPVLGVVGRLNTPAEVSRSRRSMLRFWSAGSLLFICFAIGIAAMAVIANRGA
ncbi:MAG TPA: XrtA system polysaccharide chain length determinant [Burkholderiaceae bacterium]|nr:XrtA system polysaccharide chain length determinant [Burkholderiaceae bacterium]